jgi:hypothetical protein
MSVFFRKYNTATAAGTHIRVPIIKAGSNDYTTNSDWTPAAGDVKLSKDGGAEANIGTLPTYSNGAWEFQLTAAEQSAKTIHCKIVDSATKAIEDQFFIIETFGHASAQYPTDWSLAHAQQTGDAFARLGAPGGASTAADIAAVKSDSAAIKSKTDNLPASPAAQGKLDDLESRLTATRAGYLDKLNITGNVASQADVQAINQSASRRLLITTVGQYERPEDGDPASVFEVELRTYDPDGSPVNADSTPTLTATGLISGSLVANLGSASNPATGVYRWSYSVQDDATIEQVRFDVSATIDSSTFTLACYSQVADFVATTYTTADRAKLDAVHAKLPGKSYITGTTNSDGDIQADEATGNFPGSVAGVAGDIAGKLLGGGSATITGTGARVVDSSGNAIAAAAALATADGKIDQILDDTGTAGVVLSSDTMNAIAAAILDLANGVENGVTLRQATRAVAAVIAGLIDDAGSGTETFKGIGQAADGTTRVTNTVDEDGNRTAIALNL